MATLVLATKLHVPEPGPNLVSRARLVGRLNQGTHHKLTLISAPAGFGKTTVVSAWIAGCKQPVAWLSLSAQDGDLTSFLTYLIAALQTLDPHIGQGLMGLLQFPQLPPTETLLTLLINDLAAMPEETFLVLDDYHVLDSPSIDTALIFLIEHLPSQMHVMITTREDPQLPLARLRARGELNELRAADLRFTHEEIAQFLNQTMGLTLSSEAINTLGTRTEGWIAGLQLAALSMQGQIDAAQFIDSFSGTHHYIFDYLIEEVLSHQPPHIQTFLLHSAILDRLCAPLCDTLLRDTDHTGQEILESIHLANLFLIPLDNERRWYRYHHLFGDFLRQRLQQRLTEEQIMTLHRAASQWYEDNGYELEALQHAAEANDVERVARLIESDGVPLYLRGATRPILHWLDSLPRSVLDNTPSLWVTYAIVLTVTGQRISDAETMLITAETLLEGEDAAANHNDLLGQIATVRAMLEGPHYDIEGMLFQSQRALELLHKDNLPMRTLAVWSMGLAHQYSGDRAPARQAYMDAISISKASQNSMVTVAALTSLGQLQEADNQLYLAQQSYHRVLDIVGDPPWPSACETLLGLARIHYQWNDLEQAEHYARQGDALGRQIANVDTPVACGALLARLQLVQGDQHGAANTLADTEQFAHQHNFRNQMHLITIEHVRFLLMQGNVSGAARLAETHDLLLSKARTTLAQQDYTAALSVLSDIRHHAKTRQWLDDQLQVTMLEALTYAGLGDDVLAQERLEVALMQAGPDGFIRIFVDEGQPMHRLIATASERGVMPEYTRRLLAAFDHDVKQDSAITEQQLIEPLSERELEILRLIADGLSNQDICGKLHLALSTVKGHNRNIFDKLGVKRRTEAVARARELALL